MLSRVEKDTTEAEPLKIGTLLINEGFIRKADLDQAMEIQRQEANLSELPLGKLLVKRGLIDKHQLQRLLEHPELIRDIESYAVESGSLSRERLERLIQEKPAHQPLPEALVAGGFLTETNLKYFFEAQLDSLKICELAMECGMVSETDMTRALEFKRPPRAIGQILCEQNLITPLDLNTVLTKHRKHLQLGEVLLKHGMIDATALDSALEIHQQRGEPLTSILIGQKLLSETALYRALSIQYNIPFKKLDGFDYPPDQRDKLTKIVGKTFSNQFHILPLEMENSTLTVAVSDPHHLEIVNSLRSKRVDLRTQCVLVTPATMERLYTRLYRVKPPTLLQQPPSPPPTAPRQSAASPPDPPPRRPDPSDDDRKPVAEAPGPDLQEQQLIHLLLAKALQAGARSIHIDQGLRSTTVRLRAGESLAPPSEPWPEAAFQEMAGRIMERIKEIAGMDPGNRHHPQEGVFRAGMPDGDGGVADMDFSVTTCPTLAGENMTVRRIGTMGPAPNLDKMPHAPHVLSALKQAMTHMSGMFLVASPPGNSRTGTLYGMLRHMHHPDLKAVTVEEAVSFSLPEAAQIQANPAMGLSLGAMLRTAIRLDPDILLAGELSDPESAALGLEASRKGIRLLAGIHAPDAAAAITALLTLEMPPVQTAGLLRAVLAQRWVRKICPDCSQTYTPAPREWHPLFEKLPDGLVFHRGEGCPRCGFTGYRDRILLSELLVITEAMGRAIKQRLGEPHLRHLMIRSGARTLIHDGLSKLHLTTLQEIIDAVPPEAAEVFRRIRADEETPADTAYGVTLWDIAAQGPEIRRLHHAYEVLMEEAGRTRRRSGLEQFETFIKSHHEAICRRHGTDRVHFSVKREGEKVVLLAAPEGVKERDTALKPPEASRLS